MDLHRKSIRMTSAIRIVTLKIVRLHCPKVNGFNLVSYSGELVQRTDMHNFWKPDFSAMNL